VLNVGCIEVGKEAEGARRCRVAGVLGRYVAARVERSGGGKISTFEAIEVVLPMSVWYWDRRRCGQTGISAPQHSY